MVRMFDPETDKRERILELWNECYGTTAFSPQLFSRLNVENLVVITDQGEIVGFALLLDGGMPYAILDNLYIQPRHRRFATQRDVFQYVDSVCADRGMSWFYAVLPVTGGEAEQTVSLLNRRAHWKSTYMGERPTLCRPLSQ